MTEPRTMKPPISELDLRVNYAIRPARYWKLPGTDPRRSTIVTFQARIGRMARRVSRAIPEYRFPRSPSPAPSPVMAPPHAHKAAPHLAPSPLWCTHEARCTVDLRHTALSRPGDGLRATPSPAHTGSVGWEWPVRRSGCRRHAAPRIHRQRTRQGCQAQRRIPQQGRLERVDPSVSIARVIPSVACCTRWCANISRLGSRAPAKLTPMKTRFRATSRMISDGT